MKTPTDNPVNERFIRTLKEEFFAFWNMTVDLAVFNRNLTEWLVECSFVRPHQLLGHKTPWEYYPKASKLLPVYSFRTATFILFSFVLLFTGFWPRGLIFVTHF